MARKKKKKPKKFPDCKYRCQECKFEWQGYRKDPNPPHFRIMRESGGAGPTLCPKCGHDYTDWVNYETWAEWYRKNIGDGGCGDKR